MEGYGGFGLAMLPAYRASAGLCWLTKGGTYVVSCLRGGDEFGPAWHKAGMREGKSLSHDDFAAIAADLVRRGVTRPELLACVGGSNGGLLVANMLTRYPDRFGAIVCAIPLIDMRRYTRMPAGASWIAEYGDPDKPEDWAFIRHFSAYHNVSAAAHYPPILITTSTRDDRVHPGHARKFAAKLEDLGYRVLFHETEAGGHSGGADNRQRADKLAMEYAFVRRMLEAI
jgi:prolyl oligopeptidase